MCKKEVKLLPSKILKWTRHAGYFHAFVVVCCLFSKLTFSKNYFRNTIRVSNGLNLYQDLYQSWSGSKLFAKVSSRRQKSLLACRVLCTTIQWGKILKFSQNCDLSYVVDMRGSRKFFQRGSIAYEWVQIQLKSGHHRPNSNLAAKHHFDGVQMMAQHRMLAW